MGLFSRKSKNDDTPPGDSAAPADASGRQTDQPANAAPPAGTIPRTGGSADSLITNALVQNALAAWGEKKNATTMNGVLRQCATGDLLVDISDSTFADLSQGLQPGDTLAIGQVVDNAGARLLLVYTSNDALRAYRQEIAPISLGQPASAVMKQALSDFEGVAIDPGSPFSCIIYNAEIQAGLTAEPGVNEALKTALAEKRSTGQIRELAASAPTLFVGVTEVRNEAGEVTGVTIPSVKTSAGELCALVFTSPAEVWAFDETLSVRTIALDDVVGRARSVGQAAVMIDPMGPWALLHVSDFAEA